MTCASNGFVTTMFPSTCLPDGYQAEPDYTACGQGCPEYDEAGCAADDACQAIRSTDGVFRGCDAADRSCPPVVTCGVSPSLEVAEFGGCLPYGWSPAQSSDCSLAARCAELTTAAACDAAGECMPIRDVDTHFYFCMAGDVGCGQMLTTAYSSRENECVTFESTCLPPGWKDARGSSVCLP